MKPVLLLVCGLVLLSIGLVLAEEGSKKSLPRMRRDPPPACPENCSGHGDCRNSACQCTQYYKGVDCSIYERQVTSGEVVRNSAPTRKWQYYKFVLSSAITHLDFHVREFTVGDTDLYIQFGEYPRRDFFRDANLSIGQEYELSVLNPEVGTWYAGIFGYYACDYEITITASTTSNCPNACSNHGSCNSETAECTCNPFYAGADCSLPIRQLVHQVAQSRKVDQGFSDYYYVQIEGSVNEMRLIVNETTSDGDSDLYVAYNRIPKPWDYDTRDTTNQKNYQLTMDGVRLGTYYIAVYGYKTTSYTITAQYASMEVCANRCADHGDCQGRICNCYPDFSGEECEIMLPELQLDAWVSGFVRDDSWNYFHVTPDTSSNLVVSVSQDDANGDCDLYIKGGSNPSKFDYDYRDFSRNVEFELVIENPQGTTWYMGVYGFSECSYRIRAQTSAVQCPNACSRHGTCRNARCICNSGWAGEDCGAPLHHLTSGIPRFDDVVITNGWQYYKFEVGPGNSYMLAQVLEKNTTGNVWLYVNHGAPPTLVDHDYADTKMDTANHVIYFRTSGESTDSNYFVGVYGDPISEVGHPVQYTVVAYSPPI